MKEYTVQIANAKSSELEKNFENIEETSNIRNIEQDETDSQKTISFTFIQSGNKTECIVIYFRNSELAALCTPDRTSGAFSSDVLYHFRTLTGENSIRPAISFTRQAMYNFIKECDSLNRMEVSEHLPDKDVPEIHEINNKDNIPFEEMPLVANFEGDYNLSSKNVESEYNKGNVYMYNATESDVNKMVDLINRIWIN